MSREISGHTLLLVSEPGSISAIILQEIQDNIFCRTIVIAPHGYLSMQLINVDLLLFDNAAVTADTMQKWQPIIDEKTHQAVINVGETDRDRLIDYLSILPLDGIFYSNDNNDTLQRGIRKLLDGEMWISRDLSTRFLFRVGYQKTYMPPKEFNLSGRERQVAELLLAGDTNREIADKLFVSLHTVKSHIHNIFRKMDVDNRRQALEFIRCKGDSPLLN